MPPNDYKSSLSPAAVEVLEDFFRKSPANRKEVETSIQDLFTPKNLHYLDELLRTKNFQTYLERSVNASPGRFGSGTHLLLRRVALEISPAKVGSIARAMTEKNFKEAQRIYYKVPMDMETYDIFRKGFIAVTEADSDLTELYCSMHRDTGHYFLLKSLREWEIYSAVYPAIHGHLLDLLLWTKDENKFHAMLRKITSVEFMDMIRFFQEMGFVQSFLDPIFSILSSHSDPVFFLDVVMEYASKYPYEKYRHQREVITNRFVASLPFMEKLLPDDMLIWKKFLTDFYHWNEPFTIFIWKLLSEIAPEKAVRGMEIFISPSFYSIKMNYQNDMDTIRLLVKAIITAIAEMKVRQIGIGLYPIIIKLLLGLKIDRNFIKRRALFIKYVEAETSSSRLQAEVLRLVFFEYIFIMLKLVEITPVKGMDKFVDDLHRIFVKGIDPIRLGERDYPGVLNAMKEVVWAPYRKKYSDNNYLFNEITSIAHTTRNIDRLVTSLEKVEPEDFSAYAHGIKGIFKFVEDSENPSDWTKLWEAFEPDYWYRVSFQVALGYNRIIATGILGLVKIENGEMGAYTDGKRIFLPDYVSRYKDPLEPITENRNLSIYAGLTLHECGHILAGTFRFDLLYYVKRLEKPDLFQHIHNVFEDYRIEVFLEQVNAHPQAEELIRFMNETFIYNWVFSEGSPPQYILALFYIASEAQGYGKSFAGFPEYQKYFEPLFSASMNLGRFKTMQTFLEYGIERLRNIEIPNPLGAYPLAREFYEIMKHWPNTSATEVRQMQNIPTGRHRRADEGDGVEQPRMYVETEEGLKSLQREYNRDPKEFLENHNLPVFPQLFPDDKKKDAEMATAPRHSEATEMILEENGMLPQNEDILDYSRRTVNDDDAAKFQTQRRKYEARTDGKPPRKKKGKGKRQKKKDTPRRNFIRSLDTTTGSRTLLAEVNEYPFENIDYEYLKKFAQWEFVSSRVKRQLRNILPRNIDQESSSMMEGDLNMERLIEVLSSPVKDNSVELLDLFIPTRRSAKIIIGLDTSGSTDLSLDTLNEVKNRSKETTVLDIEKAFAIIFARSLQSITKDIEIYSFNSWSSTNVYRAQTIEAISGFVSDAANRDGDFIRYITGKLSKSREEEKFFFLISDGQPVANNYTGDGAVQDTAIAMREAVKAGIKMIYFNIDPTGGQYYNIFKESASYARRFLDPEDILPAIPEMIKYISRSVF